MKKNIKARINSTKTETVDKEMLIPLTILGGFVVYSAYSLYRINKEEKRKLAEAKIILKDYAIRATPAAINLLNNFGSMFANFAMD